MDAVTQRHPPLLTVHEVAERLRSGEHTIRRLIKNGELPALRVGQQYRIDGDELERWLYGDPPARTTAAAAHARRANTDLPRQPAGREINDEEVG